MRELDASDWTEIITEAGGGNRVAPQEDVRREVRHHLFEPDATPYVDRALSNGWIEAVESGAVRSFALPNDSTDADRLLGVPDVDSSRVQSCLAEAVNYYHSRQTSLQRGWIQDQWGLPNEVINRLQIGWADSNNDLIDHLRNEAYSDAETARSGVATSNALKHVYRCPPDGCNHYDTPQLLNELRDARVDGEIEVDEIDPAAVVEYAVEEDWHRLYDWWDKRVVFPYPDEYGDYRYLIARRTHASDDVQGKYLKLQVRPHTDNEAVYEPIFGVHDYEGGDDLILTEGITDAIWAHQRSLDCLAPVTKQFKRKHLDQLVALCEDAERVYLCNDAEETSNGLKAALRTADHLSEKGIQVEVADLPRENETKVDLADYLADHSAADLYDEVLSGAVSPEAHPMYDRATDEDGNAGSHRDYDAPEVDSPRGSALFDLSLNQVIEQDENGVRLGYRGDNPIDHVGNSHSGYFVYERYKGDFRARDYKAEDGYTYTPLTWLACSAGARHTSSPSGSLTDEEIYESWKHAKDQEMIPDDDPVPYRVIPWLARSEGLLENDYPVDDEGVPAASYNAVLELIRRDGYHPGRKPVGSERDEREGETRAQLAETDDGRSAVLKSLIDDRR